MIKGLRQKGKFLPKKFRVHLYCKTNYFGSKSLCCQMFKLLKAVINVKRTLSWRKREVYLFLFSVFILGVLRIYTFFWILLREYFAAAKFLFLIYFQDQLL